MKNRHSFYKNDNQKIDLQRLNIELCIIRFRKFLDHQKKYIAKQTERQICEGQTDRQTDGQIVGDRQREIDGDRGR